MGNILILPWESIKQPLFLGYELRTTRQRVIHSWQHLFNSSSPSPRQSCSQACRRLTEHGQLFQQCYETADICWQAHQQRCDWLPQLAPDWSESGGDVGEVCDAPNFKLQLCVGWSSKSPTLSDLVHECIACLHVQFISGLISKGNFLRILIESWYISVRAVNAIHVFQFVSPMSF